MRRFRVRDAGHGEWSVLDMVLGYRICNFHDARHGSVHVHETPTGPAAARLPDIGRLRAESLMRRYARKHARFDVELLRKEVRVWRSSSSHG